MCKKEDKSKKNEDKTNKNKDKIQIRLLLKQDSRQKWRID